MLAVSADFPKQIAHFQQSTSIYIDSRAVKTSCEGHYLRLKSPSPRVKYHLFEADCVLSLGRVNVSRTH